jgi:hypothetical protein
MENKITIQKLTTGYIVMDGQRELGYMGDGEYAAETPEKVLEIVAGLLAEHPPTALPNERSTKLSDK